ncbi:CPBP family intramembrane glutamic endopeptidase [Lacticaseibacillus chiayiensis]|uniref:CPBP family intramembrane glutamic endopeptidase n=1 Tax=Lacticaseibacillus chiayiensis TaxID=2100821 RepID=UPI00101120DA|nr:type II CAAX endopeptidase family protein [Lacticaseibacillus chiayiensis]RXT58110.1 CPBP family intramembrane metalloprotease [Lacticaseibacillus chiayiensis]
MSLQKHAFSVISAYLVTFIANLLIFQFMPVGWLSLGIVTLISVIAMIAAVYSERQLVIANAIEAPGVLAPQQRVFWGVIGIAGVLAAQLVGSWLEMFLFKMPQTNSQIHQQLSSMTTNPWYFLAIGLAIPILEELAFRKVLFGNLVNVTGVFRGALIASLLFALTQPGGHWLSATLVGLVLAYDYRHTGAISTAIIAHVGALWVVWLYYIAHAL